MLKERLKVGSFAFLYELNHVFVTHKIKYELLMLNEFYRCSLFQYSNIYAKIIKWAMHACLLTLHDLFYLSNMCISI